MKINEKLGNLLAGLFYRTKLGKIEKAKTQDLGVKTHFNCHSRSDPESHPPTFFSAKEMQKFFAKPAKKTERKPRDKPLIFDEKGILLWKSLVGIKL